MYIYIYIYMIGNFPVNLTIDLGDNYTAWGAPTPSSHSKNSAIKICSKGWVAQKPFLTGSLTAALRFSKGWVRKDTNLGLRTGCSPYFIWGFNYKLTQLRPISLLTLGISGGLTRAQS